ncbi:dihydrodipicolinate synthase family protein [soil metagenome]
MPPDSVLLPRLDGTVGPYRPERKPVVPPADGRPSTSRVAYAAAHVVCDPLAGHGHRAASQVDWDATLAFRRHLWSLGLGVAEALDTAQRGMGLEWSQAAELIRRSAAEARAVGGRLVCGAATDHLAPGPRTLDEVVRAYGEQCEVVEAAGARPVLMASRHLAAIDGGSDAYLDTYGQVLDACNGPVVLHWLGEMFDPALAGYWGATDLAGAAEVVMEICTRHDGKVEGVKVSLLDEALEVDLRRRLPDGVRVYTGDDFAFPGLIRGDAHGHSDALLGIFDPIAPVAASALRALDDGDVDGFGELLEPTVELSRHLFAAPTFHYKTGIVLLAYLNGHQAHFRMLGGLESARSVRHLGEAFALADRAGALADPELAVERMRRVLALAGVDQDGTP